MGGYLRLLFVAVLWLGLGAAAAHADRRVALVIGNAAYAKVPALANPISDSAAIAASLERLGFTVTRETDLTYDGMRRALRDFSRVAAGADIAAIYFAGHGIEVDGRNYLIPVDARLATDLVVPYEAISLDLAVSAMEGAHGTRLVLLDACRDNPFLAAMRPASGRTRSISRGLARVEPNAGTLIAYAAKEGTTAADGDGAHSPFTEALLEHLEEPGIDVQFLLRRVHDTVVSETGGQQEPVIYGSLPGQAVYLNPPAPPSPKPLPPSARAEPDHSLAASEIAAEVAFWNSIKDTNDRDLLQSYLRQFPDGRFAALAHIFIARIDAAAAPPPKAAEAPPPAEGTGPPPPQPTQPGDAADVPGPVAALPPQVEPAPEPLEPTPAMIRDLQKELDRVGCNPGAADGIWGRRSRRAAETFARYAKLSLETTDPSRDLLAALQDHRERVCPLVCGVRYNAVNGRCVEKTCGSGLVLNSKGHCVRRTPTVKRSTPSGGTTAGGNCHEETLQQCISRLMTVSARESPTGHADDLMVRTQCTNPSRRIMICR